MARIFYIGNPVDGRNQQIYYNKSQDKKKLLNKVILDYWSDYCNEHWIWLNKFDSYRFNHEDKVKQFLGRCGTFLIWDDFSDSNVLTKDAINKIKSNEYSLEGDWQNEELEIELEETSDFLNKYIKDKYAKDGKMLTTVADNEPVRKKKEVESKTSKILNIYSEEEKDIDFYNSIHISNTFNVWERSKKTIPARQGVINKSKPYTSRWCAVDTENTFEFQDCKYKISEEVSQYNIRSKMPRFDDYKDDYQMDQVLVYEQGGVLHLFDQNINRIDDNYISIE